jgi:hypothetical protein
MEKQKIGFLSLFDTDTDDSYVGALLVTDDNGIPLEFKCTHSVKPTAIQKSLYGDKLKPYIAITLCGLPLLNNISNKPDILFLNIPYALGLRPEIEIPTFLIRRTGESINLQTEENVTEKQKIESESGQFQSIILQTHPDNKEELMKLNGTINHLFNSFDLIEPFDRMSKSIEILGRNDTKFK